MAGLTPIFDAERKEQFLDLIAAGIVTIADAARAVGVSPQTPSRHRSTDPDFAAAWDWALQQRLDLLETTARMRALTKSDSLLIRLLEAENPEKFAPRSKVENRVGGIDGEPLGETAIISRMAALLNAAKADDVSDLA